MNEDQIVIRAKSLLSGKVECPKCFGGGWLWRNELDSEESGICDDTQYACDYCLGYGFVEIE